MGGVDVRGGEPEPSGLPRSPDPATDGGTAGPSGDRPGGHGVTAKHIRGSTLFVFGRGLSMVANFLVQVLIVRYLPTEAYGAFTYALSFVNLGETLVTLGIDRAVGRFLPIYEERGQWGRLFGTIGLVLGTIAGLGLMLVVLVVGLQGVLLGVLIDDARAVGLVVILAVLAPIQALDTVLTAMFAVFASPRTIFVRRYLLTPALRITIAMLLIAGGLGVEFLAWGYVATGVIGVSVYGVVLITLMRRRGLLVHLQGTRLELPAAELYAYTLPLLTTDLVYLLMNTSDAIILGAFHGVDAVASLRVVQPLAGLNQIVVSSFTLLFTPAAARLFAREDRAGMRELYWQTAIWIAVFSFPLFVITTSLAYPVTTTLYEQRYADSALVLALLAVGRYVDAALGFNGLTLRVFGNMRAVVGVNLVAAATNLGLNLALIPPFGALGAAASIALTLVTYNIAKQLALHRVAGIPVFEFAYARVYLAIVAATAALALIQAVIEPPVLVGVGLAGLASLLVLLLSRDLLRIGATFPELRRVPLARFIIGPIPGTGRDDRS